MKYNKKDFNKVKRLYKQKQNYLEVSRLTGINAETIRQWIIKDFPPKKCGNFNPKKIYLENATKYELAYLLGTYIGDGSSNAGFLLDSIDYEYCFEIKKIIDKITNTNQKIKYYENLNKQCFGYIYTEKKYRIMIKRKLLKIWLENHKLNFKTKKEKFWFIGGFFDSDGCVQLNKSKLSGSLRFTQKNPKILYKIQKWLEEYKIESNIFRRGDKSAYDLNINKKIYWKIFYDNTFMSIIRKKERIEKVIQSIR